MSKRSRRTLTPFQKLVKTSHLAVSTDFGLVQMPNFEAVRLADNNPNVGKENLIVARAADPFTDAKAVYVIHNGDRPDSDAVAELVESINMREAEAAAKA